MSPRDGGAADARRDRPRLAPRHGGSEVKHTGDGIDGRVPVGPRRDRQRDPDPARLADEDASTPAARPDRDGGRGTGHRARRLLRCRGPVAARLAEARSQGQSSSRARSTTSLWARELRLPEAGRVRRRASRMPFRSTRSFGRSVQRPVDERVALLMQECLRGVRAAWTVPGRRWRPRSRRWCGVRAPGARRGPVLRPSRGHGRCRRGRRGELGGRPERQLYVDDDGVAVQAPANSGAPVARLDRGVCPLDATARLRRE